jgi:hypothetical protein
MKTKHKVILKKLLLLVISSTVALIVLEVVICSMLPFYDPRRQIVFRKNEEGVPLGPFSETVRQRTPKGDYDLPVTFNQFGFRDEKDLTTSTKSDWFALGDSFGLGWGVAATNRFSNVLDQALPSRVFNICIPTDIAGYAGLLQHAHRCGATVSNLLVSVCMENDLRDYRALAPNIQQRPSSNKRLRAYLKSHSAIYLLASYELQRSKGLRDFFEAIGVARKVDSDELMHKNEFNREAILYSAHLLDEVAGQSKRSVVLIIPSRALWMGSSRSTETLTHDLFVSELKKRGVDVLDMKPLFEAEGNPLQYYFRVDPHWNELGHKLAGQCIARHIGLGQQSPGAYSSKAADGLTRNAQE